MKDQYWIRTESEIRHSRYGVDYDLSRANTPVGAWFETARIAEKPLSDEEIGQLVRELLKARPHGVTAFYR